MDLAGRLFVQPGRARPHALRSTRADWAPRLGRGCEARRLPARLASLYTLCAEAHRLTAEHAVRTALNEGAKGCVEPQPATARFPDKVHEARRLRLATARDQVLRIGHDWSRWLGEPKEAEAAAALLPTCPLWHTDRSVDERLDQLPDWLSRHWLDRPISAWWVDLRSDPTAFALAWAARADTFPARRLRALAPLLRDRAVGGPQLDVLHEPERHLPGLALALEGQPGFALQPVWKGAPAETGPWTRRHDPLHDHGPTRPDAWLRLFSRLVDLVRLALPDGDHVLSHGAQALGEGHALAWTEMSRGLLVHTVRLEEGPLGPTVADCRVLAPTEWNFHPQGAAAEAVAATPGAPHTALALLAAWDPCIEVELHAPENRPHA